MNLRSSLNGRTRHILWATSEVGTMERGRYREDSMHRQPRLRATIGMWEGRTMTESIFEMQEVEPRRDSSRVDLR